MRAYLRTDDVVRARSRMRLDPVLRGAWVGSFNETVRAGSRALKRVWLGDIKNGIVNRDRGIKIS